MILNSSIIVSIFLIGLSWSKADNRNFRDINSFSGFGGQNKSGFETLSCEKIVGTATKSIVEKSRKIMDDAGLNRENCKQSKIGQVARAAATLAGFSGVESDCQKKLSFIQRKLTTENEDLRKILKIRMALYDVQYIHGKSPKANEWFSKFNCESGIRRNAFIPLAQSGRPNKPNIGSDTDNDLISKLEGLCEATEPMIGSAIPTFTVVANELYGNAGLNTIAKDRAICQKVIDDFRTNQIQARPRTQKVEGSPNECPPLKENGCQDILLFNSSVTGDSCKYAQFEYCLLSPPSTAKPFQTMETTPAGDLK